MKVKSVKPCGRADVFNMEVEDTHEYAVAGGIIVHNCDESRYVCMARPINPPKAPPKARPEYNPLDTDDRPAAGRYAWYIKH